MNIYVFEAQISGAQLLSGDIHLIGAANINEAIEYLVTSGQYIFYKYTIELIEKRTFWLLRFRDTSGIFEFVVREYQLAEGVMQYAQTV